jgi:hypothetical protein
MKEELLKLSNHSFLIQRESEVRQSTPFKLIHVSGYI